MGFFSATIRLIAELVSRVEIAAVVSEWQPRRQVAIRARGADGQRIRWRA